MILLKHHCRLKRELCDHQERNRVGMKGSNEGDGHLKLMLPPSSRSRTVFTQILQLSFFFKILLIHSSTRNEIEERENENRR